MKVKNYEKLLKEISEVVYMIPDVSFDDVQLIDGVKFKEGFTLSEIDKKCIVVKDVFYITYDSEDNEIHVINTLDDKHYIKFIHLKLYNQFELGVKLYKDLNKMIKKYIQIGKIS